MYHSKIVFNKKSMMKKFNYSISILLMALMLGACSKDFVDIEPQGVISSDLVFAKLSGIESGVIGVYSTLNSLPNGLTTLDMMYVGFGSIASDDAEAGGEQGGNDFADIQDMDKGTTIASEPKSLSDNFWAYNYKTIMRANALIAGIDVYKLNEGEGNTELYTLKKRKAEMLFIRAFTHFKLLQVYGRIPLVDHVLASSEYNVKNSTVAQCLHFVERDLLQADSLFSSYSDNADEVARVSKGAVESLLAKAYLYEASYRDNYAGDARFEDAENKLNNTYAKSLLYAEKVINCGRYKLVGLDGATYSTYWDKIYGGKTPGFRYIFTTVGENSQESIFSVQAVNDGLAYMYTRGTYLTVYTTARNYATGTKSSTLGWGFNCPTTSLVNEFDPLDPRFKVAVGQTGDSVYALSQWGTLDCHQSPTNRIGRKFECGDEYWLSKSTDGNSPCNYPYIRFGDVVLMAAEAALKTGDATKARNYVNDIRKRARNGAATGIPSNYVAVTFDDIVKERRLELAMEGSRFFDLVRWKKAASLLDNQSLQTYLNGKPQTGLKSVFQEGKNEFFPIPAVELTNTNGSLTQNPNY